MSDLTTEGPSPVDPYTLVLEWPVVDVLAYALLRTIDDLEARAIVAEHHDPEIGPISAREYRADILRLRQVLDQVAPGTRDADPERAAINWIDGVYTVADGVPVRMVSQAEIRNPRTTAVGAHRRRCRSLRDLLRHLADEIALPLSAPPVPETPSSAPTQATPARDRNVSAPRVQP